MNKDIYGFFLGLLIISIPFAVILTRQVVKISRYKKTSYFQITHIPYQTMKRDKGRFGEYETYRSLQSFESKGAKFLFNLYLPKGNNETAEIDVLMIYQTGIFVFESKNYSGWIFGEENQKNWTQTLPHGRGRTALKEHFPNPVWQNKLHIASLKQVLEGRSAAIFSLIVFSNRCELKNVNLYNNDIIVIHRREIVSAVNRCVCDIRLSENEISSIYSLLYPYSQTTQAEKQKHIDAIQRTLTDNSQETINPTQNTVIPNSEDPNREQLMVCPRCGAALILRTAKRGVNAGNQFYGCSNYPTCKYIKNI